MTNLERRQRRYKRRKQRREEKQNARRAEYSNFDTIFTFKNLWRSHHLCCLGVGWKGSTQKLKNRALSTVAKLYDLLHSGRYKSRGFYEFNLRERGKLRHIKSVHITERIVQRCLCSFGLVPLITPTLIYDNGASTKGKGIDFSKNRLKHHLMQHYRTYDISGYALVYDFSSFFDNINHGRLLQVIKREITDIRTYSLYSDLISAFGDVGLGLGSQVSQISALKFPDVLDKYIKSNLKINGYGRYMDDGYLIHPDKEYLKDCYTQIYIFCKKLGIILNKKKTQIVKLTRGLPYLKQRFIPTTSGKILMIPQKASEQRQRRKIKFFAKKIAAGKMTVKDALISHISWRSHMLRSNSARRLHKLDVLFQKLILNQGGVIKSWQ